MPAEATASSSSPFRRMLEITAAIATVLGVVVGVYFSVRAERSKSLSLRYLSTRALISPESESTPKLQVEFQGRQISHPYLMSARLENTGSLPVEERDIERPLVLRFPAPTVLGVEVSERSPADLEVAAAADSSSVTVSHKLLNPGDWITFDVLFDGHPKAPSASMRVSGIREITQLTATEDTVAFYPTLFSIPRAGSIVLLSLGTVGALVLVGAAFYAIGEQIVLFFRGRKRSPDAIERMNRVFSGEPRIDPSWSMVDSASLSPVVRELFQESLVGPSITVVDSPQDVAHSLSLARPVLERLNLSVHEATDMILREFRAQVPGAVAKTFYYALQSPDDRTAHDRIQALPFTEATTAEFILKARQALADISPDAPPPRGWAVVDKDELQVASILLAPGLSALMVMGGTWRSLFG